MKLREYLKTLTPEQRMDYATRCGTTDAYLFQLAGEHRQPSAQLSRKLAEESGFSVLPQDLRPDIFGDLPPPSRDASACTE
jgi:DNA-binding transcriptional regulator YdaS (Cro superfamily)